MLEWDLIFLWGSGCAADEVHFQLFESVFQQFGVFVLWVYIIIPLPPPICVMGADFPPLPCWGSILELAANSGSSRMSWVTQPSQTQ